MVHFGKGGKPGGGPVEGETVICRDSHQLMDNDSGKDVAFFLPFSRDLPFATFRPSRARIQRKGL